MKENIKTITNGLDIINNLNPIQYNKIDDPEQQQFGFASQEVKDIMLDMGYKPNTIYTEKYDMENEDSTWGIQLTELIAPIISALQDIDKRLKRLEEA